MAIYRICDRWDVILGDKDEDVEKHDSGYDESTSMLNFLDRYPRQVARNQWCFWYLVNQLEGTPDMIVHYCAGTGFNATICEHILVPKKQTLMDIDLDCVRLLRKLFPNDNVSATSFYTAAGKHPADVAVFDINDCTAVKLSRNAEFLKTLSRIVDTSPITVIVDLAISHLPVNRKVYSKALGYDVFTIQDYIMGMSTWLYNQIGAYVVMTVGHHGATWLMLMNDKVDELPVPDYIKTPPEADKFFYRVI